MIKQVLATGFALVVGVSANAQMMPNNGAYMNNMMQMQMRMQQQSNMAVRRMYNACITHPGACNGASQSGTQAAINRLNNQYQRNNAASMQNANRNQQSIDNTRAAITGGGTKLCDQYGNNCYWSGSGTNTLTGH